MYLATLYGTRTTFCDPVKNVYGWAGFEEFVKVVPIQRPGVHQPHKFFLLPARSFVHQKLIATDYQVSTQDPITIPMTWDVRPTTTIDKTRSSTTQIVSQGATFVSASTYPHGCPRLRLSGSEKRQEGWDSQSGNTDTDHPFGCFSSQ